MTVKKVKKILLIIIPVLLIALLIYVAFKEITPLDDTKKLYINCGRDLPVKLKTILKVINI